MNESPERLYGISNSHLSIARHYGGCTFNGKRYVYIAERDELVRDDIYKADKKAQNAFERSERAKWTAAREAFDKQGELI